MAMNVAQTSIASHLMQGNLTPGAEISIKIDRTLTQDATGTLVMLAPLPDGHDVPIEKGPNIKPLPVLEPLPNRIKGPVLLKFEDNNLHR